MLKLSDFAKERGIARDTITQYIRRNSEMFENHTELDGKWLMIDEEAERILSKKYPLPVQLVLEDKESRTKLIQAQETIIQLQSQLATAQQQIATAEATKMLLEDKEKQLIKAEERLEKEEQLKENALEEIKELQNQLEIERNKSWFQKLLGK